MIKKAGKETIKYINKQNILNFFRGHREARKSDIVEAIGLSAATVSSLTQELLEEGYLREKCYAPSSGGRKPMIYTFYKNRSLLLAVNVSVKGLTFGLLNLNGEIVWQKNVTGRIRGEEALCRGLSSVVRKLRHRQPEAERKIEGAVYSIPGILDSDEGRILYSSALFVENFAVGALTKRLFGRQVPVSLFRDTEALMLHEYYRLNRSEKNVLYLYCDSGVGMAVMNRGKLLRIEGNGLEIGHTVIDLHGERCKCSSVGCVGTLLGEAAALHRFQEIQGQKTAASYRELLFLEREGSQTAAQVLEEQRELLAVVSVNAVNLFNPELVIVGGPLVGKRTAFIRWAERVRRGVLKPFARQLDFAQAQPKENAALFGMTKYVLDREVFKELSI